MSTIPTVRVAHPSGKGHLTVNACDVDRGGYVRWVEAGSDDVGVGLTEPPQGEAPSTDPIPPPVTKPRGRPFARKREQG